MRKITPVMLVLLLVASLMANIDITQLETTEVIEDAEVIEEAEVIESGVEDGGLLSRVSDVIMDAELI